MKANVLCMLRAGTMAYSRSSGQGNRDSGNLRALKYYSHGSCPDLTELRIFRLTKICERERFVTMTMLPYYRMPVQTANQEIKTWERSRQVVATCHILWRVENYLFRRRTSARAWYSFWTIFKSCLCISNGWLNRNNFAWNIETGENGICCGNTLIVLWDLVFCSK